MMNTGFSTKGPSESIWSTGQSVLKLMQPEDKPVSPLRRPSDNFYHGPPARLQCDLDQFAPNPPPSAWYFQPEDYVSKPTSPSSFFADIASDEIMSARALHGFHGAMTTTEYVAVPSCEHVAEIVGRQGCKIKALRVKTDTYVKTPIRGEPPIFMVTGRPDNVAEAKREIECAAEHFSQIRASRRQSLDGVPVPGHVTCYVRVPLRVVGLVVGPKGTTIKRIQQDTHTYIITPSREREPIFEVTGLPKNVCIARQEIENHIYLRTGNKPMTAEQAMSLENMEEFTMSITHNVNIQNRPNYGALAAGTHEMNQREAAEKVREFVALAYDAINKRNLGTYHIATFSYKNAMQMYKRCTEDLRISVGEQCQDIPLPKFPPYPDQVKYRNFLNENKLTLHVEQASISNFSHYNYYTDAVFNQNYQGFAAANVNSKPSLSGIYRQQENIAPSHGNWGTIGQRPNVPNQRSESFMHMGALHEALPWAPNPAAPNCVGPQASSNTGSMRGISPNSESNDEGLGDSPSLSAIPHVAPDCGYFLPNGNCQNWNREH